MEEMGTKERARIGRRVTRAAAAFSSSLPRLTFTRKENNAAALRRLERERGNAKKFFSSHSVFLSFYVVVWIQSSRGKCRTKTKRGFFLPMLLTRSLSRFCIAICFSPNLKVRAAIFLWNKITSVLPMQGISHTLHG